MPVGSVSKMATGARLASVANRRTFSRLSLQCGLDGLVLADGAHREIDQPLDQGRSKHHEQGHPEALVVQAQARAALSQPAGGKRQQQRGAHQPPCCGFPGALVGEPRRRRSLGPQGERTGEDDHQADRGVQRHPVLRPGPVQMRHADQVARDGEPDHHRGAGRQHAGDRVGGTRAPARGKQAAAQQQERARGVCGGPSGVRDFTEVAPERVVDAEIRVRGVLRERRRRQGEDERRCGAAGDTHPARRRRRGLDHQRQAAADEHQRPVGHHRRQGLRHAGQRPSVEQPAHQYQEAQRDRERSARSCERGEISGQGRTRCHRHRIGTPARELYLGAGRLNAATSSGAEPSCRAPGGPSRSRARRARCAPARACGRPSSPLPGRRAAGGRRSRRRAARAGSSPSAGA